MKVCVLYSGAKDSNYAMYLAKKQNYEISCLVTFISENPESYMFHTPNIKWVDLQSQTLKIPIEIFKTKGIKEDEIEDMEKALSYIKKNYNIEGVVTGAVASEYQRQRVEKVCKKLGLRCINPLWKIDSEKYLNELVESGFKVKIVGVFAEGLTKEWLGKDITADTIKELKELNKKYKIHLIGEGGEYETFVYDSPIFKRKIDIIESEKIWEGNSGVLNIKKAELSEK